MAVATMSEGTWLESIGLFQQARAGDYAGGVTLLETSAEPGIAVYGLLRLLGVYLRGEEPDKLDGFLDVSYRVGPPPLGAPGEAGAFGTRRPAVLTADMRDLLDSHQAMVAVVGPGGPAALRPATALRVCNEHTLACDDALPDGAAVIVTALGDVSVDGWRIVGTAHRVGEGSEVRVEAVHRLSHDMPRRLLG